MLIELYKDERLMRIGEKDTKTIEFAKSKGFKTLEEIELEKKAKEKPAPKKRATRKKKAESDK